MHKWISLAAIAVAFVFTAAVYDQLPAELPVHWNLEGEPDRWAGQLRGALMLPVGALVMWAVLMFLPRVDPRRANYAKFSGTYQLIVTSLVVVAVAIHIAVLASAIGWPVPMQRVIPALVGALFIVLGNALPRARSNWWFGIRTPWTLSNERVWERTHRVGGYLMVGLGCLMLATAVLAGPWAPKLAVAGLAVMALVTVVYSYVAWRRETSSA